MKSLSMLLLLNMLLMINSGAAAQPAAEKLQGVWTTTAAEHNGQPDEFVKGDTITIQSNSFVIKGKEGTMKGTLKLGAGQKLLTADFVHSDGPFKGKTALAIYEVNGDECKFCFAPPGAKDRPSELAAKAGSQNFLVTLKREKK